MRRLLLALALTLLPALAQNAQDPNERIQKVVTLKYADPQALRYLLANFGVDIQADTKLKVIALSGPRNRVTTAEDAIKQLDVPSSGSKDVDLTVYYLVGTQTNDANMASYPPIPQDLQSTVATLKGTFPFKNYYMLDVLSLRTRSGVGAETSGQVGNRTTIFRVKSASLEGDGSMIRLDGLHAGMRHPMTGKDGAISWQETGVSTDVVDVKEGQKLVVGRSSLNGPDTAIFLVLIAKVVQ